MPTMPLWLIVMRTRGTLVAPGAFGAVAKSMAAPPAVSPVYASVARPTIRARSFGFSVVRSTSVLMNLIAGVYLFVTFIPFAASCNPAIARLSAVSPEPPVVRYATAPATSPTANVVPSKVRVVSDPHVFVAVARTIWFVVAAFGRISVDHSGAVFTPPERRYAPAATSARRDHVGVVALAYSKSPTAAMLKPVPPLTPGRTPNTSCVAPDKRAFP